MAQLALRLASLVALVAGLMTPTSGCTRHCTLVLCAGDKTVELVDADGASVLARGEVRAAGETEITAFDCTAGGGGPGPVSCDPTGTLSLGTVEEDEARTLYEVRFGLPDGSFTEWEMVALELTSVTDPDFNGPGCPCTWNEGRAMLTVPDDAQIAPADVPDASAGSGG